MCHNTYTKYGLSLRPRQVKTLVIRRAAGEIRLINSSLYGRNESIQKNDSAICQQLSETFFLQILSKSIFPCFSIFKFFGNSHTISRKISFHEYSPKHFPDFLYIALPCFPENFEKIYFGQPKFLILFNNTAESLVDDGALVPQDQPIRLQEGITGRVSTTTIFERFLKNISEH